MEGMADRLLLRYEAVRSLQDQRAVLVDRTRRIHPLQGRRGELCQL